MDQIVKFSDVSKKFQLLWEEIVIFEKINLEIDRNELVLFYGPSGSGKTTLLNLITGLLLPDEGEIQVAGLYLDLIPEKDKADYRSNYLGIVFQENNLVSTLTVTENIVLFQELCEYESEDKQERIDELLTKLGIDHRKDSFPAQLSGGEKKRIAIARALSTNPYILILDEPTGNLDTNTGQTVLELFKQLNEERGTSIALVTHDLSAAKRAKRILHMHDGKITFDQKNLDEEPKGMQE